MLKRVWKGIWLFPLVLFFCQGTLFATTDDPPPKIVKIYATQSGGFAGLRDNGTIAAWGKSGYGGSLPSEVATKLEGKTVTNIVPGVCAFAALTDEGMVVTWGASNCGGDSSTVSGKLATGVKKILATRTRGAFYHSGAFAALKSDGSVVTWGSSEYGGDSSGVATQLASGVVDMVASAFDFAVLKNDGSVVSWGSRGSGNFVSRIGIMRKRDVSLLLQKGVKKIVSSLRGFVALKNNGQLVGWGNGIGADTLGISHNIEYETRKIVDIYSTQNSFAALRDDGSLLVWGEPETGGNDLAVKQQLQSNVSKVFSTKDAFAVLKTDGTVVTWGGLGGLQQGEPWEYSWDGTNLNLANLNVVGVKVTKIFSGWYAFAAVKDDGSIVTWGHEDYGANTAAAQSALGTGQVDNIVSTFTAFAILRTDGSVVTWGDSYGGGDSSSVSSDLASGVIQVVGSYGHFSALKDDGTTIVWPAIN